MDTKLSTRNNYLDWLRILAILSVFIYHSSRFFNMEDWYVKNSTWYLWVEAWNRFATSWLLPLIFVISGASLFYAAGKGEGGIKSAGLFVKDKALRLLVPWLVIVLTHESLQTYLDHLSHGQFTGSYLEYLPRYYTSDLDLSGAHLWYLWLLFLFSVILYPLMRWFKYRGRDVLIKLSTFFTVPGMVFTLALPAILLSVLLNYDEVEHNAGWTFVVYLWLTLAGFLVVSSDRLQESIQQVRWISLPLGLGLVGISIYVHALEALPSFGTLRYALGWGFRALGSWCLIMAILGFGRKHMNFSTPFLTYANEAVLPFYILHQTVLLWVGYFVVQWTIPDLFKWLIIVPVSFAIIMLLYEFLVRRFNVMRVLFGMKTQAQKNTQMTRDAFAVR